MSENLAERQYSESSYQNPTLKLATEKCCSKSGGCRLGMQTPGQTRHRPGTTQVLPCCFRSNTQTSSYASPICFQLFFFFLKSSKLQLGVVLGPITQYSHHDLKKCIRALVLDLITIPNERIWHLLKLRGKCRKTLITQRNGLKTQDAIQ